MAGERSRTVRIHVAGTGEVEEMERVVRSEGEWRSILDPDAYRVARKKGTEPPFSGRYHDFHGNGIYRCVCCGTDLFDSKAKFDSGTGWPSFWEPVSGLNVRSASDTSLGMVRTEVCCGRCGAHLGHVFDDGPPPTHLRYCMNSASLKFIGREELKTGP